MTMSKLMSIIQSYIGMKPQDKQCSNYSEMQVKMSEEIIILFDKEIVLGQNIDLIESALNHYWNDANQNLQRKDLGHIEKKMYENTKKDTKSLLNQLDFLRQ